VVGRENKNRVREAAQVQPNLQAGTAQSQDKRLTAVPHYIYTHINDKHTYAPMDY